MRMPPRRKNEGIAQEIKTAFGDVLIIEHHAAGKPFTAEIFFPGNEAYPDSKDQRNAAQKKLGVIARYRGQLPLLLATPPISSDLATSFARSALQLKRQGRKSSTWHCLKTDDASAIDELKAALTALDIPVRFVSLSNGELDAITPGLYAYTDSMNGQRQHIFTTQIANSISLPAEQESPPMTNGKPHKKANGKSPASAALPKLSLPLQVETAPDTASSWREKLSYDGNNFEQFLFELRHGGVKPLAANEIKSTAMHELTGKGFIARFSDVKTKDNQTLFLCAPKICLGALPDLIQFACGMTDKEARRITPVAVKKNRVMEPYCFYPLTEEQAAGIEENLGVRNFARETNSEKMDTAHAFQDCVQMFRKKYKRNGEAPSL